MAYILVGEVMAKGHQIVMVHNSHAIMLFVLARNAENSLSMGTYVFNASETGIEAK
jgi:cell division protein YceG involved in septum cleavage